MTDEQPYSNIANDFSQQGLITIEGDPQQIVGEPHRILEISRLVQVKRTMSPCVNNIQEVM